MTEFAGSTPVLSDEDDSSSSSSLQAGRDSQEEEGQPEGERGHRLTAAQTEVLERCLHALTNAKNDSHTLAALLLITRLCPANQLDQPTLRRIFEAVGLSLPARLLVTAVKGSESAQLPPEELLSLGTALLAALSTEPDMASNPQLLTTVPLLLGIISDGPTWNQQKQDQAFNQSGHEMKTNAARSEQSQNIEVQSADVSGTTNVPHDNAKPENKPVLEREDSENVAQKAKKSLPSSKLDEALAADCYQVLTAVCTLPRGPDQLLNRGAIPALCQALEQNQTLSQERGVALLGSLLSGKTRYKVWCKHPTEMLALLSRVSKEFCQAKDQDRLDKCDRLLQFLPPPGVMATDELKQVVSSLWVVLRPMMQAKLTPKHIGSVLVLCACLLDLHGWESAGPPKFCCLLVNRACVEVRMGLEEPPGNELSPELQHTLTGCYRIMEAAMEQACSPGAMKPDAPPQTAISGLSLQQSRQVLMVLEEAFSAVIYHLQQVDQSRYGDPFIFATFRCLCSWLAEETSCLKEEVTALLPFLVGYASSHMRGENTEQHLSSWMSEMSVSDDDGPWTGRDALRYLLPALCHLSAEEGPRKVLLTLDTPALLVDFLLQGWSCLKEKGGGASRDPSMETACSALLNFTVTEPERVRKDPCFKTLESLLGDALPVLVHKSRLLVLAANFCTLGLMIGRLKPAPSAPVEPGQRRFFSVALRFLHGALDSGSSPGPVRVSPGWEEWWEDVGELWRLGLQALGGCVRAQPWIITLVKEEGWLKHTLTMLEICSALPDPHTQAALEEALCAMADQCSLCKQEIKVVMVKQDKGALSCMGKLRRLLGLK